jgi:FHA domain
MQRLNAPAELAGGGQPSAPASTLDLNAIDVSSLDRLIAIRQEQVRIDGYRSRAEDKKSAVTEAVYLRVMDDYDRRAAGLDQQSAPLRAQARAEYRKLKTLLDEVGYRYDQAKLQAEEVDFRHAVGELDDEERRARLAAPQSTLDECEAERRALDGMKARFVDALGSVDALEGPPEPVPVAPLYPAEPRVGPARQLGMADVGLPLRGRQPLPPDPASGPTMALPNTGKRLSPSPIDHAPRPLPSDDAVDEENERATMMVASAAIVLIEPAALSQDFQLGSLNGIGRSDENQICLSNSGISRKHAVIKAVPGGFAIKDLGSQNGTFVNGHRVTDQVLDDGDTIEVGSVKFVFRMPWEATPAASLGSSRRRS